MAESYLMKPVSINPDAARRTLFLPVIARALESKKANPVLLDPAAMEIADSVNSDFTKLIFPYSGLNGKSLIERCICLDRLIKDFIRRYPTGTIVDIGCGLNTTFERVNNGLIKWYDLDLPDVIELRKLFMKKYINREFIACSFSDSNWYRHLDRPEHILFVSEGVFCYYEVEVIRSFLIKLTAMFPGSELLFDVISTAGVRSANRALRKTGIDEKNFLKWGVNNTAAILSWSPQLRFLGKYCTGKNKAISMSFNSWLPDWISCFLNIQYVVHLKVRFDYKHIK